MKRNKKIPLFSLCAATAVLCIASASAGRRQALVIGNDAYKTDRLRNPVKDARAVAEALRLAGFKVAFGENLGLAQMEAKVREFARDAAGAEAAFCYYSGHGAEVGGANYLVPVDADVQGEFEVKHETLPADRLLGALGKGGPPLKVVVLDCCRNNPFGKAWSRSSSKGLATVTGAPKGTIIAFATSPGEIAWDGNEKDANSPFAAALCRSLRSRGIDIIDVFRETMVNVQAATGDRQRPWLNTDYGGKFVLRPENPARRTDGWRDLRAIVRERVRKPVAVALSLDKPEYFKGDRPEVTVRVAADCQVALFNVDPEGTVTQIFPNKHFPNNRVKGGKAIQILPVRVPDTASEMVGVEISEPLGEEFFLAVAGEDLEGITAKALEEGVFYPATSRAAKVVRFALDALAPSPDRGQGDGDGIAPGLSVLKVTTKPRGKERQP